MGVECPLFVSDQTVLLVLQCHHILSFFFRDKAYENTISVREARRVGRPYKTKATRIKPQTGRTTRVQMCEQGAQTSGFSDFQHVVL